MKRVIIFLIFISVAVCQAQEVISLKAKENSFEEIATKIEAQTGYEFYFSKTWTQGKSFTGEFTNASISEVLDALFNETNLNYFVDGDKVIITLNNAIYDTLPSVFYPKEENETVTEAEVETVAAPVFYTSQNRETRTAETVRIGRENAANRQKRFRLTGYITLQQTGDPIPDLAIVVRDRNVGAVTDDRGYYEINLPAGSNVLEFKSLGTETLIQNVIIYNDGNLNIQLSENLQQLGEVLLDATKNQNVEDAIAGAEEINVEESKNIPLVLGERDIFKVATTLPGISTQGEASQGFNVRGGKADQNLVLLDKGIIYNPSHFFGIFSAINPFTTESVDVYKGHIPAKFGGRLSSVFDIHSKKASTTNFNGEASIGPVTSNLMVEVPVSEEKGGLIVGGRATYSDYILKALDEESLKNSSASFYDAFAKYDHKINDRNAIRASGYYSKDRFSINSDSIFSYSNMLVNLGYDFKIKEKTTGALTFSHSDYDFNIDYDSDPANSFGQNYGINETSLQLDFKYLKSAKHQFEYGLSSKLYNVQPGSLTPEGQESNYSPVDIDSEKGLESAIYFSDNYKISDKLLVNAGLRLSMFNVLGPRTERNYEEGVPLSEGTVTDSTAYGNNDFIKTYGGPEVRLSARYLLNPTFSIKASYNNTLQYIHTLSNNTTASPTDTYTLSSSFIEPQRANQFSLGFYKNFNDSEYEVSLEGYYKTANNVIDFKTGSQLFLNQNIETEVLQGKGKSYGAELLIKKTLGKFNGYLGYTYSRSLQKFDSPYREETINNGEFFSTNYDKPHDVSLVANYKLTKRFSFSANFVYQTGRPVTFPVAVYTYNDAEYVLYSDRNQFRIPDYYRLDLGINIEGNHKLEKVGHSFINISVYNVLGRNNPYAVYFVTDNGEVQAYQNSIFSVPVPTITYNFKF